jgi:hypothetical protein
VLSASTDTQSSYLRADGKTSIFTYHLVEALTGHAQPQAGAREVLVSDVMSYVHRKVPESARAGRQAEQTPDFQVSGNFPVALLLGGKGLTAGQAAPAPESVLGEGALPAAVAPATPTTIFDQREQTIHGHQTNIGGNVEGPLAIGDGARAEQRTIDTGGGPYVEGGVDTGGGAFIGGGVDTGGGDFAGRDSIRITGDGNVVGNNNRVNVNKSNATRVNTRALRAKLRRLSEGDLDALCMDDFPSVYNRFAQGLQRIEKENLLLDHCRRNPADATRLEWWLSQNL